MKCQDARKFIQIYLDNELGEADSRELELHVSECSSCERALNVERAVIKTIRMRTPRYSAPISLRMKISSEISRTSVLDSILSWINGTRMPILASIATVLLLVLAAYYGFGYLSDRDMIKGNRIVQASGSMDDPDVIQKKETIGTSLIGMDGLPGKLKLKQLNERFSARKKQRAILANGKVLEVGTSEIALGEEEISRVEYVYGKGIFLQYDK